MTSLDFSTVMIKTNRFDESLRFYRDTLGLPVEYSDEDYASFDTGDVRLSLHLAHSDQELSSNTSLSFNVKDVDETYEQLKQAGVEFRGPPEQTSFNEDMKWALCQDPNGITLQIIGPAE